MKKYLLPILSTALCLNATGAFAQKKGLVKSLAGSLSPKIPPAVSAQVAKQGAAFRYHPVFGYIKPQVSHYTETLVDNNMQTTYNAELVFAASEVLPKSNDMFIQVAPLLVAKEEILPDPAFEEGRYINLGNITQASYLWRVAHPGKALQQNPYLYKWAQLHLKQAKDSNYDISTGWDLPTILFLERLLDPNITPTSYAKLYELTPVYPKHITLNEHGFPEKTADASYAEILDNYLMLANLKEMVLFNNAARYTPFVLTKEERAAADKLLALRQTGEQLPANPTVRDLLELAYNQLETHTVPYSKINREDVQLGIYKAYPNYKNTQLYRMIKDMLKKEDPALYDEKNLSLAELEILHLFVLDAVMGGVNQENLIEVRGALSAFDKLCSDIFPQDEKAIAHLNILQRNLRVVFSDFLKIAYEPIDWNINEDDPRWQKAALASYASCVLEGDIRDLAGRNWKSY